MTSKIAISSLLGSLALCGGSASAQLDIEKCSPALDKDSLITSADMSTKLFAYASLTEEQYNQRKKRGDISIEGYGTGTYKEFKESLRKIFSTSLTFKEESARLNYSKFYLSDASKNAYLSCIDALAKTTKGFKVYLKSVTSESIVVALEWNPPPSADGSALVPITVNVSGLGANFSPYAEAITINPQDGRLMPFERAVGKEFLLLVNGRGIDPKNASVLVPPYIPFRTVRRFGETIERKFEAKCATRDAICANAIAPTAGQCRIVVTPPEDFVFARDPELVDAKIADYSTDYRTSSKTQAAIIETSGDKIVLDVQCSPTSIRGAYASATLKAKTFQWAIEETGGKK